MQDGDVTDAAREPVRDATEDARQRPEEHRHEQDRAEQDPEHGDRLHRRWFSACPAGSER
jgi:hypothetical protein